MKKEKIRVFEVFAGYGGASFGLKRSGLNYKVIGMSEFDKFAYWFEQRLNQPRFGIWIYKVFVTA